MTRKKVLISLPEKLLLKMDHVSISERVNRSELICEAMQHYLSEKQWAEIREKMKVGYLQMSYINREWAELGVASDAAAFEEYENLLVEGEPRYGPAGEIYYADLNPVVGSEQGGFRPVLIIQNDIGNRYSPTVIVAAITTRIHKARLPTHIEIKGTDCGLKGDSVILTEQLRTLDKTRLKERVGILSQEVMTLVDEALQLSLGVYEV